MNRLFTFLLVVSVIFLSGCAKSLSNGELNFAESDSNTLSKVNYSNEIVSMLSSLPLNNEVCLEVATVVNNSVNYGLDEDFLFRELWSPKTKVSSVQNSLLKQQIESYLNANIETKSGTGSIENILKNSDISIYWPYCDDWDGKTLPTITCPPKDETQEWNYGYKLNENNGSVELEVVIVNEEYALENPVWIIKDTDYDYTDLPSFINGEFSSNGVIYIPEQSDSNNSIQTKASGDVMYGWIMSSMTVSKQYDKIFWSGGSEFRIAASFPTETGYAGSTNTFNTTFTRKQIRNSTTKNFNTDMTSDNVLNYDWKEGQYSNGFAIWEVNGKKATTDYTLGCTATVGSDSAKVECSAIVKITPKDELVTNREYTRSYMFSSTGKAPQKYDDGNVVCTYMIIDYKD